MCLALCRVPLGSVSLKPCSLISFWDGFTRILQRRNPRSRRRSDQAKVTKGDPVLTVFNLHKFSATLSQQSSGLSCLNRLWSPGSLRVGCGQSTDPMALSPLRVKASVSLAPRRPSWRAPVSSPTLTLPPFPLAYSTPSTWPDLGHSYHRAFALANSDSWNSFP